MYPRPALLATFVLSSGCECQLGLQWAEECAATLGTELAGPADEQCGVSEAGLPHHPQAVTVRYEAFRGVDTSDEDACESAFRDISENYVPWE